MAQKGSCIIAEDFKKRLSPLHSCPLFLDRLPFNYAPIFFALTLHAKHILTEVAGLLTVNPKREMAFIFGIRLRSLQAGGLDG